MRQPPETSGRVGRMCRMPRLVRSVLYVLPCLTALTPRWSRAQARTVSGHVNTTEKVPLSVTPVLLRDGETGALVAQALTDVGGVFRFAVHAGRYRLVTRRVGFRPDSLRVDVSDADAPQVELQLEPIVVTLAQVAVTVDVRCTADLDAPVGTEMLVWDEVAKGIEERELVRRSYRYVIDNHREQVNARRFGSDVRRVIDTVLVNDPTVTVPGDTARDRYASRTATGFNVRVFRDSDLLAPSFLRQHCRGTPYRDPSDGSVRIAFQPKAALTGVDAEAVLVRGVVVLDATTWRTRRVEYAYVQDGGEIGSGQLLFEDRRIEGTAVALVAKATGSFRVPGAMARLAGVSAQWVFSFGPPRDVVRVNEAPWPTAPQESRCATMRCLDSPR